jgi:two-component system phosphate regulon response regulator PhoB
MATPASGPRASATGQRVLVVEDDTRVLDVVVRGLERAGISAEVVSSGADALPAIRRRRPDLVLLDLELPSMGGLEVCRRLKQAPDLATIPVIIMTAQTSEVDRIVGLELGADDYVGKPFNIRELVLRVQAVLKRTAGGPTAAITCGALVLDLPMREVSVAGQPVVLTAREFDLLAALVTARGRPLSRSHLLRIVWGYEHPDEVESRTIDVHVRRLRQKLGAEAGRLVTLKHVGYRFTISG